MDFSNGFIRLPLVKIKSTQLAAALVALGYEVLPETDYTQQDVIFIFDDVPILPIYEQDWLGYLKNEKRLGVDPLSMMFQTYKARQWILDRVIHGNHNQDMTLPPETMPTSDLRFAVCLVSLQCYLIKLDKEGRTFHFTPSALEWKREYDRPRDGSHMCWARRYLKCFDDLAFKIHGRNSTRQNQTKL